MSKQLKVGDVVATREMPDGTVFDQAEWQATEYKCACYQIKGKEKFTFPRHGEDGESVGAVNSWTGRILSLPSDYKPNDSPDPLEALRKCVEALENIDDLALVTDALSAARALLEKKS